MREELGAKFGLVIDDARGSAMLAAMAAFEDLPRLASDARWWIRFVVAAAWRLHAHRAHDDGADHRAVRQG